MPKIVDHEERRLVILDALWRIVNTRGAEDLSIRSIASEAGLSKSNVTYYFSSRGEILGAAVEQVVKAAWESTHEIAANGFDVEAMVRSAVEVTIPTTPKRRRQAGVWRLLIAEAPGDAELTKVLDDFNRSVLDAIRWGIDALDGCGLLKPDLDLDLEAMRLHALIDGLSLQTIANPRILSTKVIEQIVRRHLESIVA